MGSVFHKGKWVKRYGLTCGYWSNSATKLDRHVVAHVADLGHADDLYDVASNQYRGEKLHQCRRDGVESS